MPSALFAFDDRDAARRVVDHLVKRGLSPDAVQLHAHDAGPSDKLVEEIDELATGGFIRNFLALFEGVFEWGASPHDASAYAETIRRGGAVVSVEGETSAERAKAEEVMADEAPALRTGWAG